MPTAEVIRDVCTSLLKGLEQDLVDYIASLLEEFKSSDTSELQETIVGFLLSSEYLPSEEIATIKCQEIFDQLLSKSAPSRTTNAYQELLASTSSTSIPLDLPRPPPAEVHIVDEGIHIIGGLVSSISSASLEEIESATNASTTSDFEERSKNSSVKSKTTKISSSKKAKDKEKEKDGETVKVSRSAKSSSKKQVLSEVDRVQLQEKEIDAELEAARVTTARVRSMEGAYNGALEAASFTLPNPGGGAPLLENAAMTLVRGRRYGLIGRNGKGKSTMLRALAARRVGNIPSNVSMYYVSQEVQLTEVTREQTPVDCVVAADIERKILLEELQLLEDKAEQSSLDLAGQRRQSEIMEQLDIIESDSAERRAVDLLVNLGFSDEMRRRPLKDLSGGWRVRTMLAAAIFAKPDLLLLDEPTNHLSILAVLWLARELATAEAWQDRIVVIVSHDRFFIDEVCTDCLHISGVARRLTQSHGNYTAWATRRKLQQLTFARETAARQEEIDKLKEYAGHGFKYGGSSTQITQMLKKGKQAEKLEEEAQNEAEDFAALQEDIELPINLASGGEIEGFVIQMMSVSFGYPSFPLLFSGADFGVTSKSRIVLLGENGNGKVRKFFI